MHQPDYRDPASGEFLFPWVYLHAIKDYSDMAWHLEQHPRMRVTVNLVPVLLDQIEDYCRQFERAQIRDPLLRLLIHPAPDAITAPERSLVLNSCFRNNHARMIEPFPAYRFLHQLYLQAEQCGQSGFGYLSGQYLADLLTWYHLAWTGESVRREQALVVQLMTKGTGFTLADRQALFELIGSVVRGIIPRYRALAAAGQIEISTTPHQHPLAPLLLDLQSARESEPGAELPKERVYPGGRTRVAAHIASAVASHSVRFGAPPKGIWPAEGALSEGLLDLLSASGCAWTASSEAVLANSLQASGPSVYSKSSSLHRPYQSHGVMLLFRDDRLSDLIGFEYAKWHGKDAADHFVAELEAIADRQPDTAVPVVSVMLDGENAWEYYPYNGYYFLQDLYSAIEQHRFIRPALPSDCLQREREGLGHLVAGSWVYGTFSTWIGSHDKNRAWDLLCAAKRSFDLVVASHRLSPQVIDACERRLAVCEASDWFWWFGDYNPAHAVSSFDTLFRRNLTQLYQMLELVPPAELVEPISRGGGEPEVGGAMRRAS
ncbi:MAG: glycoside hydrolase [Betaproteobacteria bacterium]|nr:MAG: glycoside hydrolase [Betaproteobacteria bacterium]